MARPLFRPSATFSPLTRGEGAVGFSFALRAFSRTHRQATRADLAASRIGTISATPAFGSMTFFVRKQLALGPIRFGVSPRQLADVVDSDVALSTGPEGEFVRRRGKSGYFFGDTSRFAAPSLPVAPSISSTSFLSSLKPDGTPRSYGFLALMIFGALFVLVGFSVVARKGPQGWVEVILGLAMIATPLILTAQQRKTTRDREERERAEREARETRNRELLFAYTTALEQVRRDRTPEALQTLAHEREALTLPYDIWGGAARRTALLIGFDELSSRGVAGAREVSRIMSEVARAAGMSSDDARGVKADLYGTIIWHLLADDRLGPTQEAQLLALRKAFDIWERDAPQETKAAEEFRRLRGITVKNLPHGQSSVALGFQEQAIHQAGGGLLQRRKNRWIEVEKCKVVITNKRLIIATAKPTEIALPLINDIDVDVDENVMTLDTAGTKKPLHLRLGDPIYTAALIELAANLDQRPKGFA